MKPAILPLQGSSDDARLLPFIWKSPHFDTFGFYYLIDDDLPSNDTRSGVGFSFTALRQLDVGCSIS